MYSHVAVQSKQRPPNKMDNNFSDILNIFKRLDESTKFANEDVGVASPKQKYRVEVTVSDPDNTMVSQRKELKRRVCKVTAADENTAVERAIHWYKKQGYKVHDHHFIGADEQSLTEFGADGIGATPGAQAAQAADPAADAKELQATTQALQKLGAASGTKIPVSQTAKSLSSDLPPSPADNAKNAMVAKQIEPLLTDPSMVAKLTSLITQQQNKPKPPGAE